MAAAELEHVQRLVGATEIAAGVASVAGLAAELAAGTVRQADSERTGN
jgi:hypothetical protein